MRNDGRLSTRIEYRLQESKREAGGDVALLRTTNARSFLCHDSSSFNDRYESLPTPMTITSLLLMMMIIPRYPSVVIY